MTTKKTLEQKINTKTEPKKPGRKPKASPDIEKTVDDLMEVSRAAGFEPETPADNADAGVDGPGTATAVERLKALQVDESKLVDTMPAEPPAWFYRYMETVDAERQRSIHADANAEPVMSFYGDDWPKLPELERFESGRGQLIGPIADVAFSSGYFGELTPAQLAIHILAGQSIGLDPARALFDLEISTSEGRPFIRYRPGQPLQAAEDAKDAADAAIKNVCDRTAPEPASAAARDNVLTMPAAATVAAVNAGDQITVTPGPIAVPDPIPADEPAPSNVVELADGAKVDVSARLAAKIADLANKGVLSVPNTEKALTGVEDPAGLTGVTEPGNAAALDPGQPSPIAEGLADVLTAKQIGLIKSGARSAGVDAEKECFAMFGTEISTLTKRAAGDLIDHFADLIAGGHMAPEPSDSLEPVPGSIGDITPVQDPATPEPALTEKTPEPIPAAVGAAGDETGLIVSTWRAGLALVCDQLDIPRKEKLDTFDAGSIADKRKMYDAAQKHYDGKVDAARSFVLDSLTADGKSDNETRKGFFIYADVGLDPDKWTYLEAFRAQNAVNAFVGTKPAA